MDSSTQTSCHYAETSLMRSTDDSFYDFRKLFVQGLWSNPIDLSSSYQYQSDGLQSIEEVDENDKEAEEEENSKQKDTEVEVETVYPTVIQSSIYTALELPIENLLDEMINLAMTEGNSTTSSNSSGIEVGSSAVSSCSNKSSHLPIILREEFNFGHYYPKNKRNSIVSLTDKYSSTFTIAGCGTVKSLRKSRGFTRSKPKFSNGSVFRGNERIESKIVVAIDFGTAQCGFAYTLQTEFNSNSHNHKIKVGFQGRKIPSVLLLNNDGSFNSFGSNAIQLLSSIDVIECENFRCFKAFKNKMISTNDSRAPLIRTTTGEFWPAKTVFSHSLACLKHEVFLEIQDTYGPIEDESLITWVITVPALWKHNAKQLIREAAYEAGLIKPTNGHQLIMSIEPEVAAISCLAHDKQRLEDTEAFMVVDCGGGTTDITAYQLTNDANGALKIAEVVGAAGVPCGSVSVDRAFEELLRSIFGPEFMNDFKRKNPAAHMTLMSSFEARKCQASLYSSQPATVLLPFSFIKAYQQRQGHTVECAIHLLNNKEISWSSQGMLKLSSSVMRKLFTKSLTAICEAINNVLSRIESTTVTKLYLVGGYSESQLLRQTLRSRFEKQLQVITSSDPSLAVLKGAVKYGLNPNSIAIRQSRQTYGLCVSQKFIVGLHPVAKQIVKNDQLWCSDVFERLVSIGQPLSRYHTVVRRFCPAEPDQNEISVQLYATDLPNPQFVTDIGVEKCAIIQFHLSQRRNFTGEREIEAELKFGETEISISANELINDTAVPVRCEIDFLC